MNHLVSCKESQLITCVLFIDSYDGGYLCYRDLDYNNCKAETNWNIPQMKLSITNAFNGLVFMTIIKKLNTVMVIKNVG